MVSVRSTTLKQKQHVLDVYIVFGLLLRLELLLTSSTLLAIHRVFCLCQFGLLVFLVLTLTRQAF